MGAIGRYRVKLHRAHGALLQSVGGIDVGPPARLIPATTVTTYNDALPKRAPGALFLLRAPATGRRRAHSRFHFPVLPCSIACSPASSAAATNA